jgi:hypothetical protein
MIIIGIDPGPDKSGYVELNTDTAEVYGARHTYNHHIRSLIKCKPYEYILAIEMPASYGMAVGATILDTCVEIGRYLQCCQSPFKTALLFRKTIASTLCGQAKAKGPFIRQCIIDMYGEGAIGGKKCTKCKGKGWFGAGRLECTQCNGAGWDVPPGPLYNVTTHAWDALAVAIAYAIKAGYLNPLVVNPEGLGKNFQQPAHDYPEGTRSTRSTHLDEPF